MANEIQITGAISINKNNAAAACSFSAAVDLPSGGSFASLTQEFADTTSDALDLPASFAWPGWLAVKNISPGSETITVNMTSADPGTAATVIGNALKPGEGILVKLTTSAGIYLDASANTALAFVALTEATP